MKSSSFLFLGPRSMKVRLRICGLFSSCSLAISSSLARKKERKKEINQLINQNENFYAIFIPSNKLIFSALSSQNLRSLASPLVFRPISSRAGMQWMERGFYGVLCLVVEFFVFARKTMPPKRTSSARFEESFLALFAGRPAGRSVGHTNRNWRAFWRYGKQIEFQFIFGLF